MVDEILESCIKYLRSLGIPSDPKPVGPANWPFPVNDRPKKILS